MCYNVSLRHPTINHRLPVQTPGEIMNTFNLSNLFSVAGKSVLITGGSRGIGLMMAQGFVQNGAKVYISSRKAEVCAAVSAELSKHGTCTTIPADLTTNEGRAALVTELSAQEDKLDVLINNAGAAWGEPFDNFPEKGYDRCMDINVKAVFMLTRDLTPLLEASASQDNPARVINVGSIDGLRVPMMPNFPYGVSKAAVHQLTKVLAIELGKRKITVNAIAPGPFESQMTEFFLGNEEGQESISTICPLGRIGSPEDMIGIAIYLSSRAGAYVNGAVIPVDGGIQLIPSGF